jgi:hypothetical protein
MLAVREENPPVANVAKAWQTESNQPIPPRRSRRINITLKMT